MRFAKFGSGGHGLKPALIKNTNFECCDLSSSKFVVEDREDAKFVTPSQAGIQSDFSYGNLSNIVWQGVDFGGSRFHSANLFAAHIIRCSFEDVDLRDAVLINAKFTGITYSDGSAFPGGFSLPSDAVNVCRRREREAADEKVFRSIVLVLVVMFILGCFLFVSFADRRELGQIANPSSEEMATSSAGALASLDSTQVSKNRENNYEGHRFENPPLQDDRWGKSQWKSGGTVSQTVDRTAEGIGGATEETGGANGPTIENRVDEPLVEFVNSIGLKMVMVPSGTFVMGASRSLSASEDEIPHVVTLTSPFYLSVTEVTQKHWSAVMGSEPWRTHKTAVSGENYPAVGISWYEAREFCSRLNQIEGYDYRLPTEAEWEFACRSGSKQEYSFGDDSRLLATYAWYSGTASGKRYLQPVAQRTPNRWGLFDMHGNAWEWCSDWYGGYPRSGTVDPPGPETGEARVLRGGYFAAKPESVRCAFRNHFRPNGSSFNVGFRVAMSCPVPI